MRDGSTGNPHYQTEGLTGHTFWGSLGSALIGLGVGLDYLADGLEVVDPTSYLTSGGEKYYGKSGEEVSWKEITDKMGSTNTSNSENKSAESDGNSN